MTILTCGKRVFMKKEAFGPDTEEWMGNLHKWGGTNWGDNMNIWETGRHRGQHMRAAQNPLGSQPYTEGLESRWDLQLDLGWVLSQKWGKPRDVDHMPLPSQVLWYLQHDSPDLNCPSFLFPSCFWHVFCFPNQTKIPVSWFPENIARGCLYSIPASTNLRTL